MGDVREVQTLVIGAGPAGLAVAYGLQGDTLVLERAERVGGLSASIYHDGGVFDVGGHSFHTPHPEVQELVERLLGKKLYIQQRDARIYTHGVVIDYPFQKFYDQINDPEVVRRCEEGLRNRAGDPHLAANYEEYILRQFGDGIAESFMLPYNRKLWARDLKRLSTEWTSQRVAAPKGATERFLTSGGERKPLQSDTEVGYPMEGGFEEIYRAFRKSVPEVQLSADVAHVDPERRTATTSDGRTYAWKQLVSSMPLPELLRIVEGAPAEVVSLAGQLEYMSLRIQMLLTGRPLSTGIQRIYIGDPEIPPHKVAFNHNSSRALRHRPHHAIMAEVSYSEEKPVAFEEIAPRTIEMLRRVNIIEESNDVTWQGQMDVKYGYPVYTHRRPELVGRIKEWLAARDIYTLGRFGSWEYINSDACIMEGLSMAEEMRGR